MNDHLDSISQSLNRLHREGEAGIYKVSEEKKILYTSLWRKRWRYSLCRGSEQ